MSYENLHGFVAHVQVSMYRATGSYEEMNFAYDPDTTPCSPDLNHVLLQLISDGLVSMHHDGLRLTAEGVAQAERVAAENGALSDICETVASGQADGDRWERERWRLAERNIALHQPVISH